VIRDNADVILVTSGVLSRCAGTYQIATQIRAAGYVCQVIDFISGFSEPEILEFLTRSIGENTKVLGVSSTWLTPLKDVFPTSAGWADVKFGLELRIVEYLIVTAKSIKPDIKIVVGGAREIGEIGEGVIARLIDVCIMGSGDIAIVEYLKSIENKESFSLVPRNSSGQIVIDGGLTINQFDFVNSQIVFQPEDNISEGEILPIEISRGCIFKCKFCSYAFNGRKKNDYTKDAKTIREELLRGYYEYGTTKYWYMDDTHNESTEKLQMMATVAQSLPFKLEYVTYIRLELLRSHPEQYQLLKDGGAASCFFGIESLHYPTRAAIGKGFSGEQIVEILHTFAEKLPDVVTTGSFIVGLPYETKDTVQEWSRQLLNPDFPLDQVLMFPYVLTKNQRFYHQSEFDKDSSKYYTWTDDENWHNGNFDFMWAKYFAKRFQSRRPQKIGAVSSFLYQNIGYSSDLKKRPLTLQESELLPAKIDAFISKYKKALFTQN
jgi:radical SAM superfamily enzyme YgiQ (UPF0313 family)